MVLPRLLLFGLLALGCGARETPQNWRANLGKACFADEECGRGGLYCHNPGDPVVGGAHVDTRIPEDAGPPPPPPPEPPPCHPATCEQAGGRCVHDQCLFRGFCEEPPA